MQTPHPERDAAAPRRVERIATPPNASRSCDWRCTRCAKLLGVCRDGRMHLRFARGHDYLVSLPATATCRGCGTLNQASAPTR